MGEGNDRQSTEDAYLRAAQDYQSARVEYAREWQWQRSKATSDNSATQATIEATGDYARAKAMMEMYVVIRPEIQQALDKMKKSVPNDIRPTFTTAASLTK